MLLKSKLGTRFGNQFGMILLPVHYHKSGADPLQYARRAKAMIDTKKQSAEALFSYKIGDFIVSYFGPKVKCFYQGVFEECSLCFCDSVNSFSPVSIFNSYIGIV